VSPHSRPCGEEDHAAESGRQETEQRSDVHLSPGAIVSYRLDQRVRRQAHTIEP
jgi:hypothetical protein